MGDDLITTWVIEGITCYPTVGTLSNVVSYVSWRIRATDSTGMYHASVFNTTEITLDPNDVFIPYDELTQDEVISWVQTQLTSDQLSSYLTHLTEQIDEQKNPPKTNPGIPWL